MSLSELRSLVGRYVDGKVAYDMFRSEFVPQFLSIRHDDLELENDIHEVEKSCADFDEGDISEPELKDYLLTIARKPIITYLTEQPVSSFSSKAAVVLELCVA